MIGAFAGTEANYGVIRGISTQLEVLATSPTSNQVTLSAGAALVQGKWYYLDADELITVGANGSGNPRIDLIILQSDYVAQTVRFSVLQGSPGVSPAIPSLTQTPGVLWEIPIARVAVAAGFTVLAQSTITDMRSWANLPDAQGLQVSNESAIVLDKGNVVIRDTSPTGYPIAVNTTTTEANRLVAGVIETRVSAAGGLTRIITQGISPVIVDETVVAGDKLTTSTTAGQAGKLVVGKTCLPFAWVLTGASAGGSALCLVDVPLDSRLPKNPGFHAYNSGDQTVTANVTTLMDWNTLDFDVGGWFDLTANRYTPLERGYYLVYASGSGLITPGTSMIEIQLNGATIQRQQVPVQGFGGFSVMTILELNGSSDYVEAYISINDTTVDLAPRRGQFGAIKVGEST